MLCKHEVVGSIPIGSTIGRVAERLIALVLKTSEGESLPWVQIPPRPPCYRGPTSHADLRHIEAAL